ncbi:MAG: MFS transporter [Candidatus Latescibacteria bacterium]|nr:MFS transporter [bacterium]MBD3423711.1 MFS transporter [Candidatus Latescibacterota bacterium]
MQLPPLFYQPHLHGTGEAVKKRGKYSIIGWSLYDWANSAFTTTVVAGFFPVFFKQYWCAGMEAAGSTARLGIGNSMAGVMVAVMAPVLGAIADRGSARKRFLTFFAYLGVLTTALLFVVAEGEWALALLLYIFAASAFGSGNVFYDSLLTLVAPRDRMESVSSLGYALGYLGGGILFALNIWMVTSPATFGLSSAAEAVRYSFLTVALWWGIFTIPVIIFVEEKRPPEGVKRRVMIKEGLAELRSTFGEIRKLRHIFLFLLAYWFYIDGVDTVVRMAVDYGLSIGLESSDLMLALLATQLIGFPAALGFGYIGRRIGARRGIYIAIAVYLLVSIGASFMTTREEFFILAAVVGLVQGGIQALSRSFFARMIPAGKSAEYFGFYNLVGKFAAVIGPGLMGAVAVLASRAGAGGTLATRISIASVSVLFIAGGVLFYFVDREEGRRETTRLES